MFGMVWTQRGELTIPVTSHPRSAGDKCWADQYLPNGKASGESCSKPVTDCRIGLCPACAAAVCPEACSCRKAAAA